jgi:hypothetical protein
MSVATQSSTRNIRRESRPERHPGRMPSHLCVLVDLERTIAQVLRRIRQVHDARQCGCYLFIDRLQRVYVVTEEQPCALGLVKDRFDDLVGFYTLRARLATEPWLAPTVEGLREDIEDHLRDRGE